ncbi:MAG: mechanosensitive ion channel family protein [Pseudomonadota bacterium]
MQQSEQPTTSEAPASSPDLVRDFASDLQARNWIPEVLHPYLDWLAQYPLLGAAIIVAAGYVVARTILFVITFTLSHLTRRTRSEFDDKVLQLLSRPLFATIFLAFLGLAVLRLDLSDALTFALLRLLTTLVVLYWISAAFPVMALILERAAHWQDRLPLIQDRTLPLFDILCKLLVFLTGTWAILQVWNIDATAWLASAGVIGIAVGFAAKDTLANLFSGVFIVADAPYKIGDYINLDSGERGMVTHVGLRSTRILTRDDVEITVPNAVMGGAKIINEAGGRWEKMRVRIKVGVAYGSDADRVVDVLKAIAGDHSDVCREPEPRVRLRELGEYGLRFELLCWIEQPVQRGKVSHQLLMTVYKRFAEEGIQIPFPQRDVHVRTVPEGLQSSPD